MTAFLKNQLCNLDYFYSTSEAELLAVRACTPIWKAESKPDNQQKRSPFPSLSSFSQPKAPDLHLPLCFMLSLWSEIQSWVLRTSYLYCTIIKPSECFSKCVLKNKNVRSWGSEFNYRTLATRQDQVVFVIAKYHFLEIAKN